MKVSTERIPDSQVLMTIEVEDERVDDARKRALRRLAPKARVPGFRPGKAPPDMVQRYFGDERVLDEALDDLIPTVYREAITADESIVPIARPSLVVDSVTPLVVKATVPVRPTVELGDYQSVRVTVEPVEVDEERVDGTLEELRRRFATFEPSDEPLKWRDRVRIDLRADVDGEPFVQQQEAEIQLVEDRDALFDGFEEQLLGHAKGEEFEFDLAVPAELPDKKFAGKQAHFSARVIEVKSEVLPELDDEFAKQAGPQFETLDALRQRIRDDVRQVEEEQRAARWHEQIIEELVQQATIEFPPVMVDSEVDRLLHDQAGHNDRPDGLERYLASMGKTEQQMRAELRPTAEARIKNGLVMGRVAEAENIEVSPAEVQAQVERLIASAGGNADPRLRQLFTSEEGQASIRRNLLTRRTLARLVEIATEGAVPAAAAEELDEQTDAAAVISDVAQQEASDDAMDADAAAPGANADDSGDEPDAAAGANA